MKFLYQMFSDVQGSPSTNRLISAFVAVFPLLVWGYSVYKAGVWISPPEEVLLLVGGGLTSKIVQRKVEQSATTDQALDKVKQAFKTYLEKGEKCND